MGFRISWLATQASEDDVIAALSASRTGETGEYHDFNLSIGRLANGWTIVWSNDEQYFDDPVGKRLSKTFPLLACWVNETVMHSMARWLDGGDEGWVIWHEGDETWDHIDSKGALPEDAGRLIDEARMCQMTDDEVDHLFEIPLQLALDICGFKHDEFFDENILFAELESVGSPPRAGESKKGWLARIFGKR